MPVIRVSDPIFERLQAIATPLVDTSGSVIEKLLDFYESKNVPPATPRPINVPSSPLEQFDPAAPPDLGHTRFLTATFGTSTAKNWNALVAEAHRVAMSMLKSFEKLRAATHSNIASDQRKGAGFHYKPDIDISIQNVDANLAWRNAFHLAKHLRLPIRVEFEWFQKSAAANPGKTGVLSWRPSESQGDD